HRNGTNYLKFRLKVGIFLNANLRVPAILTNFSKKLIPFHHECRAGFMMKEVDKLTISKLLRKIGQRLWENMGVHIDFKRCLPCHHRMIYQVKSNQSCWQY